MTEKITLHFLFTTPSVSIIIIKHWVGLRKTEALTPLWNENFPRLRKSWRHLSKEKGSSPLSSTVCHWFCSVCLVYLGACLVVFYLLAIRFFYYFFFLLLFTTFGSKYLWKISFNYNLTQRYSLLKLIR